MNSLELLAPAGSPPSLDAAIASGADAVYLGLKNFNARLRSANFAYSQFEGALKVLHKMKRKVYVTVNTVFEQREADRLYQLIKYLAHLEPDGIIIQDFGLIPLIRENFPALKIHASTQMNIASSRAVNVLSKYGISRVVLARELSLEEIKDIRLNTNVELEVFIHGSLCVSASGLCLFSSFLGGKSANRGMCTQACRRYFKAHEPDESGYFFSPSDLQMVELIPILAEIGINTYKIEGRMKSAEYVGTVVSAYRLVIDALGGGEERIKSAIERAKGILNHDFARAKTIFYSYSNGKNEKIDWLKADQSGGTGISLGNILEIKDGRGFIPKSNVKITVGDTIRLHRGDDSDRKSHKLTFVDEDEKYLCVSIPEGFEKDDEVYLIQTKSMTKHYRSIIPQNLDSFKRMPGRDRAPPVNLPYIKKDVSHIFPKGIYVGISRIEDFYIIQSVKPVGVMLLYNRRNISHLLGNKKNALPFSSKEIILVLDPYFPQDQDKSFSEDIPNLIRLGYKRFVVNNLGHISYFRNADVSLIAGSYLYVFNRFANYFIASLGIHYFISPMENNRQNLEKTVDGGRRTFTFIKVFSYPPLFRIRADLSDAYSFGIFSDGQKDEFILKSAEEGSHVISETPFSIIDKIPFLEKAGFDHFIIDMTEHPLKKNDYKDLMSSVRGASPIPNASRFNWKDGFFQPET